MFINSAVAEAGGPILVDGGADGDVFRNLGLVPA